MNGEQFEVGKIYEAKHFYWRDPFKVLFTKKIKVRINRETERISFIILDKDGNKVGKTISKKLDWLDNFRTHRFDDYLQFADELGSEYCVNPAWKVE